MRENIIESYLRNQVKILGGKAYKFVSPGNAGVPDRLVCLPGGIIIFIETKAPGKKPTVRQKKKQRELMKLGNCVLILDSKSAVDDFIKNVKAVMDGKRRLNE